MNVTVALDYSKLLEHVKATAAKNLTDQSVALFATAPETKLYQTYLDAFEDADRQSHTCNTCAGFFRKYGGLVAINPVTGEQASVLWDETDAPEGYATIITALRCAVEGAPVSYPFFTDRIALGDEEKGGFGHFHFDAPLSVVKDSDFDARKALAEAIENRGLFKRSLGLFKNSSLQQLLHKFTYDAALRHLEAERERVEAFTEFLAFIRSTPNRKAQENLIWLKAATDHGYITGFKNDLIGQLAIDFSEGDSNAVSQYLHRRKGENYMRPKAEVDDNQLDVAQKLIVDLNLQTALQRKVVTADEIPDTAIIWTASPETETPTDTTDLFSELRTNQKAPDAAPTVMGPQDWGTVMRDLLPKATKIRYFVPQQVVLGGMITAEVESSEPIIKWDTPEHRNPVSPWGHIDRSLPHVYGLNNGWTDVACITRQVDAWGTPDVEPTSVFLHLPKAHITEEQHAPGLGLFPEILRSELYPIRAVMERYSNSKRAAGWEHSALFAFWHKGFNLANGAVARLWMTLPTGDVVVDVSRWE